jgi:hypothetical protein
MQVLSLEDNGKEVFNYTVKFEDTSIVDVFVLVSGTSIDDTLRELKDNMQIKYPFKTFNATLHSRTNEVKLLKNMFSHRVVELPDQVNVIEEPGRVEVNKEANYEQLAQLMRDNGYECHKKV